MKRKIGAFALLLVTCTFPACGTLGEAKIRIGSERGTALEDTIKKLVLFIEQDREKDAEVYLAEKRYSHADGMALLAEARDRVRQAKLRCAGLDDCVS
jgi:hypothetical protein